VIRALGRRLLIPAEAVIIDAAGGTLLPGLIDAHTHVREPAELVQALAFGVTTELDMFADPAAMAQLKHRARGDTAMAEVFSAGTGATAPGGHPRGIFPEFPTIDSPAQAEAFVAARLDEGSDYLKVIIDDGRSRYGSLPTLDTPTVTALVTAAHRHDLLVCAHATDRDAATTARNSGVDGLAHLFVDTEPAPGSRARVAAAGTFVVPTLCVLAGLWGDGEEAQALADNPRVAPWLDPRSTRTLTAGGYAPPGAPARPRLSRGHPRRRGLRRCRGHRRGVSDRHHGR